MQQLLLIIVPHQEQPCLPAFDAPQSIRSNSWPRAAPDTSSCRSFLKMKVPPLPCALPISMSSSRNVMR